MHIFYLDDVGMPCNRYELIAKRWYYDANQDNPIHGVILLLPHRRFLAGYTFGKHMSSGVDTVVFTDKTEAILHAEECTRIQAEEMQDYQAASDEEELGDLS